MEAAVIAVVAMVASVFPPTKIGSQRATKSFSTTGLK
jgi:hypothetical protein